MCCIWLKDHFNLVVEDESNNVALTLEPTYYEEIYDDEYLMTIYPVHEEMASLVTFHRI